MESVFVLLHVHEMPEQEDDEKLIGVYRTKDDAEAAILRLRDKPGFREATDGFAIDEYVLNQDHWQEGYVTIRHGTPE